jgi:pilus assembly protein CpaC
LNALRDDNLSKILAEPELTTLSGRPSSFLAGGSFYIVPQGLAASAPINVSYGTKLDYVPIVLGNGRIHLDVRPHISQIDGSLTVQGYPGLLEREAEAGVELQAGQTFAIAGLVQSRIDAENTGLPLLSSLPVIGALFRTVHEEVNDIELLILVTPEIVEAMDPCEVPPGGPGLNTQSPNDWELYMNGQLEVRKRCPAGEPGAPCRMRTEPGCMQPPPDDGMVPGAGEVVPAPMPSGSDRRPAAPSPQVAEDRLPAAPLPGPESTTAYNRYPTFKRNANPESTQADSQKAPPGFIGPVGYDVVK